MSNQEQIYVNPVLMGLRDCLVQIDQTTEKGEQLDVILVDDLVLNLMVIADEAKRLYRLVKKDVDRFHFMQNGALSAIIGWATRALETIEEAEYKLCLAATSRKSNEELGICGIQLRRLEYLRTEPGLCFGNWVFGTLAAWMNNENMKNLVS